MKKLILNVLVRVLLALAAMFALLFVFTPLSALDSLRYAGLLYSLTEVIYTLIVIDQATLSVEGLRRKLEGR